MTSMKFKVTWKTLLLPAIGLAAFFLYLYLFNVDIPTIIATVQGINLSIYLLAIAFVMLDTFFYALSWQFLLNILSVKLSVVKSLLYVWYGTFMDIVIPSESVSGEISRIYLVAREQNGTSGKVVASLVAQRLMGMSINIINLLVGISILLAERHVSGIVLNLTVFLAVVTSIFLAILILLCVKEKWTLKIVDTGIRVAEFVSRGRWKLTKIREEAIKAARLFHDSMKEFGRTPKTLFTSLLFAMLSWIFSIGIVYLVFLSIGFPIPWSIIIVTYSIVVAIKDIPIGVPFEAGLPEITMSALFIMLGVPPGISGTATILTRILTLWLRFFIGFAVQQWLEIKVITATGLNSKVVIPKTDKTQIQLLPHVKKMSQMAITIEDASIRYLDRLYEIELECFEKDAFTKQQIAHLLTDYNSVSLVATSDGKIVGFIVGMIYSEENSLTGHILTLDVSPSYRRKGIAQKLLNEIEKIFKEKGVKACGLEVRENNIAALRLYQKFGYKKIAKLKNYYGDAHGVYLKKDLT